MTSITLHRGDNRISLRRLIDQGVRVHSVVCDPPYSLTSIVKRFGKEGAAPAKHGKDGAFARASAGFMGLQWDATGIEYDPEFWALVYEVLLPGGFVFAFSSPRTGHRQACTMEMVGFIMHPFHGWVYGSGMPKAHNIRNLPEWEGWAYGTQTQKPAMEPIYLAQKPYSEKTGIANIEKHGVGAFNIDGCRIPCVRPATTYSQPDIRGNAYNSERDARRLTTVPENLGRWPANLFHDDSDEVRALFPNTSSGTMKAGTVRAAQEGPGSVCYGTYGGNATDTATYGDSGSATYGDSGSAARFFNSFPRTLCETCNDEGWIVEGQTWGNPYGEQVQCPDCDQVNGNRTDDIPVLFYNSKAGKIDRAGSKHPTVKPVALIQHLVRHITPPGGLVLDPFAGSGTTAEAARREGMDCLLMEAEPEYVFFLEKRFSLTDTFDDLLGSEFDFL